jgi:ABC-2 type transport system ATP-binding protein
MDVESRRQFWSQLHAFKASGRTLVLTTHYLEEAEALTDRVVVIDHGMIVADGAPAALSGRRRATVRFESDAFREAPLSGMDAAIQLEGRSVEIRTPEPEEALRRLFAAGVPVLGLTVANAGLEEAFLALLDAERSAA